MNYAYAEIGLIEVPGEISLCIGFTGCPNHCPGCHSQELWDKNYGEPFSKYTLRDLIEKYKDKVSCICFMGGDWSPKVLLGYIKMARAAGFATAVYVGSTTFYVPILEYLDYIKTGAYVEDLGGLSSRTTNQKMWKKVGTNWEDITAEFWRS